MNAVLCAAAKRGYDTQTITPQLYARMGAQAQERHCPFCDAVVYSRRSPLCGVCAKALPCLVCQGELELAAHVAAGSSADPLRRVELSCRACRRTRQVWFRVARPLSN